MSRKPKKNRNKKFQVDISKMESKRAYKKHDKFGNSADFGQKKKPKHIRKPDTIVDAATSPHGIDIGDVKERISNNTHIPYQPPYLAKKDGLIIVNPDNDAEDSNVHIGILAKSGLHYEDPHGNQIVTRDEFQCIDYRECGSGGDPYDPNTGFYCNGDTDCVGGFATDGTYTTGWTDSNIGDCTFGLFELDSEICADMCEAYCAGDTDNCPSIVGADGANYYTEGGWGSVFHDHQTVNGGCGYYSECGAPSLHPEDCNTYTIKFASWRQAQCVWHSLIDSNCKCKCYHKQAFLQQNEFSIPMIEVCNDPNACNQYGNHNLGIPAGTYSWCDTPGYEQYCSHNVSLCDFSCYGCTDPTATNHSSEFTQACNSNYGYLGAVSDCTGHNCCCTVDNVKQTGNRFKLSYSWNDSDIKIWGEQFLNDCGANNIFWSRDIQVKKGYSINEETYSPGFELNDSGLYPDLTKTFWLLWAKYSDLCYSPDEVNSLSGLTGTFNCCEGDNCNTSTVCGVGDATSVSADIYTRVGENNEEPSCVIKNKLYWDPLIQETSGIMQYTHRRTDGGSSDCGHSGEGLMLLNQNFGFSHGPADAGAILTWSTNDDNNDIGIIDNVYSAAGNYEGHWEQDIILDNGGTFKTWNKNDGADFQYGEYIVNAPSGMFRRAGKSYYQGIYEIDTDPQPASDDLYCENWDGTPAAFCGVFTLKYCDNTIDTTVDNLWIDSDNIHKNVLSNPLWKETNRNPGQSFYNSWPVMGEDGGGESVAIKYFYNSCCCIDTGDNTCTCNGVGIPYAGATPDECCTYLGLGTPAVHTGGPNYPATGYGFYDCGGDLGHESCGYDEVVENETSLHLSTSKLVLYDRPDDYKFKYGHCKTTATSNDSNAKTFKGTFAMGIFPNTGPDAVIAGPVMGTVEDGNGDFGKRRSGIFKSGCLSPLGGCYDCAVISSVYTCDVAAAFGCTWDIESEECLCEGDKCCSGEDQPLYECNPGIDDLNFCIGDNSNALEGSDGDFSNLCANYPYDSIFVYNTGTILDARNMPGTDGHEHGVYKTLENWQSGFAALQNWNPGIVVNGPLQTGIAHEGGEWNEVLQGEMEDARYPMRDLRRLNGNLDNKYRTDFKEIHGTSHYKKCFNYYDDMFTADNDCREGLVRFRSSTGALGNAFPSLPSDYAIRGDILQFGSKRGNLIIPQMIRGEVTYLSNTSEALDVNTTYSVRIELLGDHSHADSHYEQKWHGINNFNPITGFGNGNGTFNHRLSPDTLNEMVDGGSSWIQNSCGYIEPDMGPNNESGGGDPFDVENEDWACTWDVSNDVEDVSRHYIVKGAYAINQLNSDWVDSYPYDTFKSLMNYVFTRGAMYEFFQETADYSGFNEYDEYLFPTGLLPQCKDHDSLTSIYMDSCRPVEGWTIEDYEANCGERIVAYVMDTVRWWMGGGTTSDGVYHDDQYFHREDESREITLGSNKYTIDLFCQSLGFDAGKVLSWGTTNSGCTDKNRLIKFEPYYSDGSNPYDGDIPKLFIPHAQANIPELQDGKNIWPPAGSYGLNLHNEDLDTVWLDTIDGTGFRGIDTNLGNDFGNRSGFFCPTGKAVRPYDISCYNHDIWSPAQNYMYGEANHNRYQPKCDSFYNREDFKAWFRAYYFAYSDRTMSWKDAYEHPLYGEEVPYFVAVNDPDNTVVRECGPEVVVLPAQSFIRSIPENDSYREYWDLTYKRAYWPGMPANYLDDIIKWNTYSAALGDNRHGGDAFGLPGRYDVGETSDYASEHAFEEVNYIQVVLVDNDKSCGNCLTGEYCNVSVFDGSHCLEMDDYDIVFGHSGAPYMLGDCNGDGVVTEADAIMASECSTGLAYCGVEGSIEWNRCDVNGNGSINAGDSAVISQWLSGGTHGLCIQGHCDGYKIGEWITSNPDTRVVIEDDGSREAISNGVTSDFEVGTHEEDIE